MSETTFKFTQYPPYSLHDSQITKIEVTEDEIVFRFKGGFYENNSDEKKVNGKVIIQKPDLDFCSVHILSDDGFYGKFKGRKMSLPKFCSIFKKFTFEVTDELFGYNKAEYSGFLTAKVNGEKISKEMNISLYFSGNIIYKIKEIKNTP